MLKFKKRIVGYSVFFMASISIFSSCGKTGTTPNPVPAITTPTLGNVSISSITDNSAIANGIINNEGGAAITERGIYIHTASPAESGNKIVSTGSGSTFVANISALTPAKTYYVKGYALNSKGIAYSNEITFQTLAALPTVSTTSATASGNTTISVSGSVTADGGSALVAVYAVRKWYEDGMTAGNRADSVQIGTSLGSYSKTWTDAVPGTVYTTYISAKNSAGTGKGVDKIATTTGFHIGQDLTSSMGITGIVFETFSGSDSAYVASKSDLNPGVGIRWLYYVGITAYQFIDATNNTVGGGLENTIKIVNHPQSITAVNAGGEVSAISCYNKAVTSTKQSKWWLPNTPEWILIRSKENLPGLVGTWAQLSNPLYNDYWSSNQEPTLVTNARIGSSYGSGTAKGAQMGARPICKVGK